MATETTAASTCLTEGGSALGMPQLCADWIPNQVFWLVVALVVLFLILSRVALPRIGAVLAERRGTISNDLAAAEELKQKAVEAEKAYHEALANAKAEAGRIVAQAKAEIQKELDKATAKADAEIAAKATESEARINDIRAGALEAVTEVAKDTAKEIVAALGGKADARSITAAVSARVKG
ncbi:MAG: F0F1 ATP synthase subunit B' [Cypionkella sp.]|jgi:F-type H+-transporting ATPase subunit b|nr:F0F1 ATP synthase subunit B' [Cypionkella sp.]